MVCEHCQKENRSIAKFCKYCGHPLVSQNILDRLVGLGDVKQQLKTVVDTYTYLHSRRDVMNVRLSVNTIIIGETGTGKTALAEVIRDYFHQYKIIPKPKLTMVDAVDYQRFVEKWDENVRDAKGGILFFDNVQKLLPDRYSNQVNPLDKLFVEMDKWDEDPIVIMAGLPKGLDDFLSANPAAQNRFKYTFRLPTPGYQELCDICKMELRAKYGITAFSQEADHKLLRFFQYQVKIKDDTFGYAHVAIKTAEDIFTSFISRGSAAVMVEDHDIRGYVPEERSLEQILSDLDRYIGMDEVKKAVKEIAFTVHNNIQRAQRGLGEQEKVGIHIVLTGNPGTGKTTIARKLGEILESIGYLDSGHVVEVDRSKMVSPYQGETPKVVDRLCDKAMGGILFVDEAYTLAPLSSGGDKDQQGTQALEQLMKRMEDDRGKFVVVAAGYKDEMETFLNVNPGLASRFTHKMHIDDYNEDELLAIYKKMAAKDNYKLSPEAEFKLMDLICRIVINKNESFGNAREMRNMLDATIQQLSMRVSNLPPDAITQETYQLIMPEDIKEIL